MLMATTHTSTLIFAAFDTTSSALSRILYQLSHHPAIQDKLRAEITAARTEHGNMDYDKLVNLPYLEAVCRETLRLWVCFVILSSSLMERIESGFRRYC